MDTDAHLLRAYAVAIDVRVTSPNVTDALKIVTEHREGLAFEVLVPYVDGDDHFMIDTDSMTLSTGRHRLWHTGATPSA
ncbi:hypothetical protein [Tsukamurella paurometabola]|uniref:Uncharacterized protein n=1 Tax=Tsukamurella paurometabola TaxID=2061 RepID=A0A3P8K2S3_TSUPA|nr:hypothetical protein [Tsukamurella paurometabola]UEA82267.1 hypothetical protein LK411_18120 [Tsukamurella paurometabola]VDR39314.1 Uncharacterised protein [Tsukamurella paurometabola]